VIESDATIIAPLIFQYVLENATLPASATREKSTAAAGKK
jgi:hypothetical protein